MNVVGRIKRVDDVQQVTASFKKREFVIETQEQYPESIPFELAQESVDLINQFKIGDVVNVTFALKGRDWTNPQGVVKTFLTLRALSIKNLNNGEPANAATSTGSGDLPSNLVPQDFNAGDDDDLPF